MIAVVPPGNDNRNTIWNLMEFKAFKANIISIGPEDDETLSEISDFMIAINPEVTDIIAPLVYIVPLQLLSYYLALKKGYDRTRRKCGCSYKCNCQDIRKLQYSNGYGKNLLISGDFAFILMASPEPVETIM